MSRSEPKRVTHFRHVSIALLRVIESGNTENVVWEQVPRIILEFTDLHALFCEALFACMDIRTTGDLIAVRAFDHLFMAMRSSKDDIQVQALGCKALSLLTACDPHCSLFKENGVRDVVVAAMASFPYEISVQEYGCTVLAFTGVAINRGRVIEVISSANKKFPFNSRIAVYGVESFINMGYSRGIASSFFLPIVLQLRVPTAWVLRRMQLHMEEGASCPEVCKELARLVLALPKSISRYGSSRTNPVGGQLEAVLAVLDNVCGVEENRKALVEAGILGSPHLKEDIQKLLEQ